MLARKSKWKTGLIIVGMLAPALLIAVGIVIYPIINTIIKSFMDSKTGAFTFSNYVYLFTNKLARAHVWYTFWITCLTVVFASRTAKSRNSSERSICCRASFPVLSPFTQ